MLGDRVKNAISLRVDRGLAMFDARDIAVLTAALICRPGGRSLLINLEGYHKQKVSQCKINLIESL
jgi:hypothetical protein